MRKSLPKGFDKPQMIGETDSVKLYQRFDPFMADKTPDQEPSIEEILASIRQIISDDEEKDSSPEPEVAPVAPKPEPAPDIDFDALLVVTPPEPEIPEIEEEEEEDVLELDTPLPEEPPEEEIRIELQEHIEPTPPPAEVAMPGPQDSNTDDILTEAARGATIASMAKLAGNMPVTRHREYGNITLEDLVREMLHPMLRDWVSENLPNMVERLVQKELEKLARKAQDV